MWLENASQIRCEAVDEQQRCYMLLWKIRRAYDTQRSVVVVVDVPEIFARNSQ